MNIDNETQLRLKCLELAQGDLKKARNNFFWITTGGTTFEDRV